MVQLRREQDKRFEADQRRQAQSRAGRLEAPEGRRAERFTNRHHVGVDHKTVAAWRAKLETTWEIPKSPKRTGSDGRTINTSKIGGQSTAERSARSTGASGTGPESPSDPRASLASYWCQRVWSASSDIVECPVSAKDLAAVIRRSNDNHLRKHLEKTRDFITAVLAEADVE